MYSKIKHVGRHFAFLKFRFSQYRYKILAKITYKQKIKYQGLQQKLSGTPIFHKTYYVFFFNIFCCLQNITSISNSSGDVQFHQYKNITINDTIKAPMCVSKIVLN